MESYIAALVSALWLGILTSISPCPLASNIAAISFVSKKVGSPSRVLLAGLLYMSGRALAYLMVALVVVSGLSSVPAIANFLQQHMNAIIGPLLILVALVLIEIIPLPAIGSGIGTGFQKRMEKFGVFGALLLGAVFALAFCPVSAALYFGSLIPLALQHQSAFGIPLVYGIGTALPVAASAFVLAFAANRISGAFNALTVAEKWMRRLTALIFAIVGVYYFFVFTI